MRAGTAERNAGATMTAKASAEQFRAEFDEMSRNGYSMSKMADSLNRRNIKTAKGGNWQVTQVQRVANYLK